MKKLIILLIFSFLLFISSYTTAQDDSILGVSVKFCNNDHITKSLSIESFSGQKTEICMQFINSLDRDVLVWYDFVDWVVTNDSYHTRACDNSSLWSSFRSYFSTGNRMVNLKASSITTQKDYIMIPYENTEIINWCLTYFSLSNIDDKKPIDTINVVLRKALFIDVFPKWKLKTHAMAVKDPSIPPKMKFIFSSKYILYAVITLIIIIWTIINLVKQHKH